MRVLIVTPRNPYPLDRGDSRRVFHLADSLSRLADVRLMSPVGSEMPPLSGVDIVWVDAAESRFARASATLSTDSIWPGHARRVAQGAMGREFAAQMAEFHPDVVQLETLLTASYSWEARRRNVHVHLDLIDALSLRAARDAEVAGGASRARLELASRLLAREEAIGARNSTTISLVAETDVRRSPHLARAAIVPNGVDLDAFPYAPDPVGDDLIFFGNLRHPPNVVAARYVAREILPKIRSLVPHAKLRIVGANPGTQITALGGIDGIEVVGPVEDMSAEIHRAAVAILPMMTGTGIKNKVLEAFSSGTPVVTNAMGIDGVSGAVDGRDYIEAEGADALATAAVGLLADPVARRTMAGSARQLVETRFTWSGQAKHLLELFNG